MKKVVVVGSGASGVHFALSVLKKGYEVLMLDVGNKQPAIPNPDNSFNDLKTNLNDPVVELTLTSEGRLSLEGKGAEPKHGGKQAISLPDLLLTTNGELFRWCLEKGLRVTQQLTLMDTAPAGSPNGAYWPSILC